VLFSTATPGASNSSALGIADFDDKVFPVYPNPVNSTLLFGEERVFEILSVQGRVLSSGFNSQFDVSSLSEGTYFIRFGDSVQRFVKY
jgi:hypothetical protein